VPQSVNFKSAVRLQYRYRVYGITLASDIRLTLPEAVGNSVADVELMLAQPGTFPSTQNIQIHSSDWFRHCILRDGTLYLRWEDWIEFLVSPNGTRVQYGNLSSVLLESFEAYLTTFAISAALLQRGEEPLHATVVDLGRHTVGFVAPSGAGKSTLAAQLIDLGGSLVTDDMLRVTWDNDVAIAHPGPYCLKLFREPAERFLRSAACCGRFNPLSGKLMFQPGKPPILGPRHLSSLYQLQPADEGKPNNAAITSSTMNDRVCSPARLQRQFRFAERFAKAVPVYRLTYTRSYEVLKDVADRIAEATLP
jgi:hypothetical protein